MLTFETVNELTLKVTCTGSDVLFTKAGAFIAGEMPVERITNLKKSCLDRRIISGRLCLVSLHEE